PSSTPFLQTAASVVVGGMAQGVELHFGVLGRFVGVVDAGPAADLTPARHGVHTLGVAPLALFERSIHKHLDESVGLGHLAHLVAGATIGTDRRAYRDTAMSGDLASHEADAPNVGITVVFAETESLRQLRPHHVPVEQR